MRARAVFLDRDGVLNDPVIREGQPYPPTAAEFRIDPGTPRELQRLKTAGFLLIVVTNQPDVARGSVTRESVEALNNSVRRDLPVDDVFVCWHDDRDQCDCRKPKPGLLLMAAAQYGIEMALSFMIGDRWRDIDAGAAAGCRTVLIDYHYRERAPDHGPDFRAASLAAATSWILAQAS